MKKIIIILSVVLTGMLVSVTVLSLNDEMDAMYTDATQQSSIDKALRSFVSEPDIKLHLPSESDDYILDKVTTGRTTYYLVLLPYEDNECLAGFVMRTSERKGMWKTDRMTALYNVRPEDKNTLPNATYIYDSITDPDNNEEIYFALGKAPYDTNAAVSGELTDPGANDVFGVISTEQLRIYQ